MARFFIGYSAFATSTANKTAFKIIGTASKNFEMYEVGSYGDGTTAPADIQHEFDVGFLTNTTAGTPGASPTPEKMVQSSGVSGLTAGTKYSAESTTYNTNVFPLFSFNQRGGMRWAVPLGMGYSAQGGDTGLSLGGRVISSSAGTIGGNSYWNE